MMKANMCLQWVCWLDLCLFAATIVCFFAMWQCIFYSPLLTADIQAETPHELQYRGVNLGGWLVLEPWITPSLFYPFLCRTEGGCASDKPPAIDEQSLCKRLGSAAAKQVLEKHRSTWVTEHTFQRIAASGLNIVRIPIGYWLFGDVPDFCFGVSSVHHLDNAVNWAEKHNIQVLLDMHGVVGSANGMDNSGTSYRPPFAAQWGRPAFDGASWLHPNKLNMTRAFLRRVVARYSGSRAVVRIGMVNEALARPEAFCKKSCPIAVPHLLQYYEDTWQNLSDIVSLGQEPVLDIGVELNSPLEAWQPVSPLPSSLRRGVFDLHAYFMILGWALPQSYLLRQLCDTAETIREVHDQVLPVMVGEWSLALDLCMIWVNGVGIHPDIPPLTRLIGDGVCQRVTCPTTYNNVTIGTSDVGGPNEEGLCPTGPTLEKVAPLGPLQPKEFYKRFAAYMLSAYSTSAGWIFWNFQSELRDPRWSFFDAQRHGLFPADFSENSWGPIVLPCDTSDSFLGSTISTVRLFVSSMLCLLCCTCCLLCCKCSRCVIKKHVNVELGQFVRMRDEE